MPEFKTCPVALEKVAVIPVEPNGVAAHPAPGMSEKPRRQAGLLGQDAART
jgi:hypothetical protein